MVTPSLVRIIRLHDSRLHKPARLSYRQTIKKATIDIKDTEMKDSLDSKRTKSVYH